MKLRASLVGIGVAGLFTAAACGDDGGDGNNTADAAPEVDAADEEPDASAPELARSGTLAVTETVLAGTGGLVNGGVNVIAFYDETSRTVPPVAGFENPVGGCQVFVYDVTADQEPPDQVDAGAISVTGTANGDYTCEFVAALGEYLCISDTPSVAAGSADGAVIDSDGPNTTLTLTGAAWPPSMVGMWMIIDEFPALNAAGPLELPIAGVSDDTLIFGVDLDPADGGNANDTGDADAIYTTFVGSAPIPGGADILDDGTDDISITKAAGGDVPAIDLTGKATGEGLTLLDDAGNDRYLPNAIATDGSVVKFACDPETDNGCGVIDSTPGDDFTLSALTISGITTDATLPEMADDPLGVAMPDPTGKYAVFTCGKLNVQDTGIQEVEIPADAMAEIMGTSPTRIRVSVTHSSGSIEAAEDGTSQVNVVVGHGMVGYTDP